VYKFVIHATVVKVTLSVRQFFGVSYSIVIVGLGCEIVVVFTWLAQFGCSLIVYGKMKLMSYCIHEGNFDRIDGWTLDMRERPVRRIT